MLFLRFKKMKFFSKEEVIGISLILGFIAVVSFPNFKISLRRARDAQRKNDIGELAQGLYNFANSFGSFPLSENGKIMACNPKIFENDRGLTEVTFESCDWEKDALKDPLNPDSPPYLNNLPGDPKAKQGYSYYYLSSGENFQIYASLEGNDEDEFDEKITARKLSCGIAVCNFGRSSGATPLDKSIEEYENELLEKKLKI